jgi:hypothetical protein
MRAKAKWPCVKCEKLPDLPILPWLESGPPWLTKAGECRRCLSSRLGHKGGTRTSLLHPEQLAAAGQKLIRWAAENPEEASKAFSNPRPDSIRPIKKWAQDNPEKAEEVYKAARTRAGHASKANLRRKSPHPSSETRAKMAEARRAWWVGKETPEASPSSPPRRHSQLEYLR